MGQRSGSATGDSGGAEDISQAVFTELAKRARDLRSHPALAGWLYTCVGEWPPISAAPNIAVNVAKNRLCS